MMSTTSGENPPIYKTIGLILAVSSGFFIGSSFIIKKKGLLQSYAAGGVPGEGHQYLKSKLWWAGMILMVVGEILNFVAYAFTPAILVTPLGALSVVVSAILSAVFLNEKLTFVGKIGCAICVVGAIIIVLHAPEQNAPPTIAAFMEYAISPSKYVPAGASFIVILRLIIKISPTLVFVTYAIVVILISLFLIFKIAPRHGKNNMLVYISVCSLIGSLSVVCTQGLGASIVYSITTENQFKHPFIYALLIFVIVTLLIEVDYLNKALNLFSTAIVTPVYYVMFTTYTILSTAILFRGFHAEPLSIVTAVCGFLVICGGVLLLHISKESEEAVSESRNELDSEMGQIEKLPPAVLADSGRIRSINGGSQEPVVPINRSTEHLPLHQSYNIFTPSQSSPLARRKSSSGIRRTTTTIGPPSGFDSIRRTRSRRAYTLESGYSRNPRQIGVNDCQLALIPSAAPGLLPGVTVSRIRSISSLKSNRSTRSDHSRTAVHPQDTEGNVNLITSPSDS
ncbi:hypothetical protein K7432_012436 [Basidiobolus ranarum]|uniref:Magnesium transporter n=1 Tax=Basidiobolus ranarum TaxID=34480 RepID=A0ABR2WKS4_9FUNG